MKVRAQIICVAMIILAGWLFLSPPGQEPLTASCDPMGVVNHARGVVQGERFWHSVGRRMESELATSGHSALSGCRSEIFRRAGMEVSGELR